MYRRTTTAAAAAINVISRIVVISRGRPEPVPEAEAEGVAVTSVVRVLSPAALTADTW